MFQLKRVVSVFLVFAALAALAATNASADFTAYNDCTASTGNPANTTLYRGQNPGDMSGFMKDFATGLNQAVTLTVASSGLTYVGTGGPMPNAGTDCYNVFNGTVVFDNVAYYGSWMEARFTGLDPDKAYEVVTSVNRGNSGYTTRTTQFTISGIDSATQASTSGVTVNSPTQVTFCTGYNTVNGYVARWTDIRCGADGAFTLRTDNGAGTTQGYAMDGLMLRETTLITPTSTSVASTGWDTATTWDISTVPVATTPVIINAHTVPVTSTAAACYSLAYTTGGTVALTGSSLTIGKKDITALDTTNGTLSLDGTSSLTVARANTSASFAGLTVAAGTVLNVTSELTVDANKTLSGATINAPKITLAGATLTVSNGLSIPSGAVLTGNGTVAGPVSVAAGGKLIPGTDAAIGAVTASNLSLAALSVLNFNILNTGTLDQITVSGAGGLTIDGGNVYLYQDGSSSLPFSDIGTYNLIGFNGGMTGSATNLSVLNKVPGKKYTFGTGGGFVTLDIAQGVLWSATAGTNWNNAANWSGVLPVSGAGDTLLFAAPGASGASVNDFAAGASFASIQFDTGANAFTLSGNAVTLTGDLDGNGVLNNSTNAQTVNLPITLGNNAKVNAASGAVVFETLAAINNNGNVLTVTGPQPVTLKGAMTGSGGVTMAAGSKLNLGADNTINGTLTINGGTIDNTKGSALTLSNNPAQIWGGSFAFAGTDNMDVGTGGVTMGASLDVTVNNAKTLTVGGAISGSGKNLTKRGNGTLVLNGSGSSVTKVQVYGGGTLQVGAGASIASTSSLDITEVSTLRISSGAFTSGGADQAHDSQWGKVVVEGTGVVTSNGEWLMGRNMGHGSLIVRDDGIINGGGNTLRIGRDNIRDNFVGLFDNAQATFGLVDVFPTSHYGEGGAGSGSVLQIANNAKLTATSMNVGQMPDSANANKQYGYAQVTQSGGSTVTINGNMGIALRVPEATDVLNGTYNLNGGELKVRQINNGTNAIRGTAAFNLHGGTLTYNNTAPQTDFIALTAGGTAGSGSLYLYEASKINTNGQDVTINQPILSPNTGNGLVSLAVAAPFGNYFVTPEVYISGGDGSGATAIPVLNDAGQVTAVTVTNPGVGYTSTPTVQLWYDGSARYTFASGDVAMAANNYAGGLTKQGGGTLKLTQPLSYTGATVIEEGTLDLEGATNSLGTISGAGSLTVGATSAAALTATSIVANTLTIGADSSVTIRETTAAGNASPVPEPGTWLLLVAGAACLLPLLRRRMSSKP